MAWAFLLNNETNLLFSEIFDTKHHLNPTVNFSRTPERILAASYHKELLVRNIFK